MRNAWATQVPEAPRRSAVRRLAYTTYQANPNAHGYFAPPAPCTQNQSAATPAPGHGHVLNGLRPKGSAGEGLGGQTQE